jgi:hypothetical protein
MLLNTLRQLKSKLNIDEPNKLPITEACQSGAEAVAETFQLRINIYHGLTDGAPKAPPSASCKTKEEFINSHHFVQYVVKNQVHYYGVSP